MTVTFWVAIFVMAVGFLAYTGAPLWTATAITAAVLAGVTLSGIPPAAVLPLWIAFGLLALVFNFPLLRRHLVTRPVYKTFKKMLPPMSDTEREAIEAGTVWWEAELFAGQPNWRRFLDLPPARLSAREQAFVDGPAEELCRMVDDWAITHELHELPASVWDFLKQKGFFGMIIPERYGGLEFSPLGHSSVVMKLASRSISTAVTVMVPNSLGPAELLLHYGTEEQKDHFLPRLARGEEIPCFALTGPEAGSDAGSMPDSGVVCRGHYQGKDDVLGIRLNWQKRYITLGPVATLLGLAFKLYDPEGLLGGPADLGITLALIPTDTPGISIGNRHLPMNLAFQNGPTEGKDVFMPVDSIIGGPDMAGKGWMMLMESLAAGRSISLPALSTGSGKLASRVTGAYAAIRRQFKTAVGQFEGVQEALARIGGNTYMMDAARVLTAGALIQGEKPSVVSAIVKYHLTERMRQLLNDAMDIHGGRAICMGPRNYLARAYQGIPIAITVEGANILTRSLLIFGQGAIRCHPYLLAEMRAAEDENFGRGLRDFDRNLFAHVGYTAGNAVRTVILALTGARFIQVPVPGTVGNYYRHLTRMSAALALVADISLLVLGGRLKRLERLSARLGDVLSHLYLASAALKRFEEDGRPNADRPLLHWSCRDALFRIQNAFDELFSNFPVRWIGFLLRRAVFPLGMPFGPPNDANDRRVARLLLRPSAARDRLTQGIYVGSADDPIGRVEDALIKVTSAESATRKLQRALKTGAVSAPTPPEQIAAALAGKYITDEDARRLTAAEAARTDAIQVDDFPPEALAPQATARRSRRRSASKSTSSTKRKTTESADKEVEKTPQA
ncbi:MAG: acyl-CoA dehydrogenase [Gammaproteobacteria bacterium]|nr:MAG: acyl-CoA dehydrogenase [Gammaproteobacteria bacterium]